MLQIFETILFSSSGSRFDTRWEIGKRLEREDEEGIVRIGGKKRLNDQKRSVTLSWIPKKKSNYVIQFF